jgi:DNA polymerase III epsilon subunit-like protein
MNAQQLDMFEEKVQNPAKYVVLDFETGGLDEKRNGLCSVGIICLDADLQEIARFYSVLYEPGKIYEEGALRVNGFTVEQLQKEGLLPHQFLPLLHSYIDGATIVNHNSQFDVRWLNVRGWNIQESVCTMELAYQTWPTQKAKLGIVYNRMFGHDFVGAHNALADVEATIELLKYFNHKNPALLNPAPINWNRFKH